MTTARALYEAGRLEEAIQALNTGLRSRPDDVQARTFLFELLCFAGNWDRADKQLDILASTDKDKRLGALQYRGAISAERTRQETLAKPAASAPPSSQLSGSLNGQPFQSIEDADPRVGARLEVFAGDSYMWIPLEHVALLEIQPPKRLRDLLWVPATIQTGAGFGQTDLGQVLIPALTPEAARHADPQVRLGRMTSWEADAEGRERPVGQRILLVDGEEIPFLEVRRLEVVQPAEEAPASPAEAGS